MECSPYLLRTLRTVKEAQRDIDNARANAVRREWAMWSRSNSVSPRG